MHWRLSISVRWFFVSSCVGEITQKVKKLLTKAESCVNIIIERYTDDGCPKYDKDNRLAVVGRAVIFFFYLRFFKFAIITIKTISTISASVVIISKAKVRVKIHRHHSFRVNCERSKKILSPLA